MKKVYVNEERCLGCHLCEFYCAFANSGETEMFRAFRLGRDTKPKIRVEDKSILRCSAVTATTRSA